MFRKIALVAALIVTLASCQGPNATGAITQTNNVVTIHNNDGGTLGAFEIQRAKLKISDKKVIISGYCASACTMFYSLPNACMAKGSSLHFHGAAGLIDLAETLGNAKIASYYRAGIKDKFKTEWYKLTKPMAAVTREEAKLLDPEIKFCENL